MIIALNGYMGSGKDTAADYLVEKYDFKKVSFAKKLKESAAAVFDWSPEIWESLKNNGSYLVAYDSNGNSFENISFRTFLQRYGVEAHRDIFGEDFWVEEAFKEITAPWVNNYVITDCRFENEASAIIKKRGIIVRIERKEALSKIVHHVSELGFDEHLIDYTIQNNSSIEDLYKALDYIVYEEDCVSTNNVY